MISDNKITLSKVMITVGQCWNGPFQRDIDWYFCGRKIYPKSIPSSKATKNPVISNALEIINLMFADTATKE